MNNIFIVLAGIILAICLINYAVDFVFYIYRRYCRFHIGRWNKTAWRVAVLKKAVSWLRHTPTVKKTDNSRYILIDMLTGNYNCSIIQSWQTAALIWGVLECGREEDQNAAKKAAAKLLDKDGKWVEKPLAVDAGMLACSVMKALPDKDRIRPAMDETLSVMSSQLSKNGFLSYTGGAENPELYVDTLGLACPFLCMYAKNYNKPDYEEIAFRQIENYHQYGMYPGTSLPNHAFNMESKLPVGVFGWGRGIGWYIIGLIDTFAYTDNSEHREKLLFWIKEAAEEYKRFQRDDGGFGATVQRLSTYDSSATAVMAWFYAQCSNLFGNDEYKEIAVKCLNKLRTATRISGAIDWCQGDTKDIGVFSQFYDVMPFAQGMALRAIYSLKN